MSREVIIDELHKSARRNFKRRTVIVKGLDDLFQADLVEMIPYAKINKNYKYLLTVINTFSKYAWAIPIKNKTGQEVARAMDSILFTLNTTPRNFQTDHGLEFYNIHFKNLMKKYNINHYSTFSGLKSSIVERFNRTIKGKMWKQFSLQGSYKWLDILPKLIANYNNTKHRTIAMKPIEVNAQNELKLLKTVYSKPKVFQRGKFKIGDYVRISKYRQIFDKSYTPNWSTEIFRIYKVRITNPVTYLLEDYQNNKIHGGFYQYELQNVKYPHTYLVEKIIKRKGTQSYVKWLGFTSNHNSWVNNDDII
jgi:Integrase core domain